MAVFWPVVSKVSPVAVFSSEPAPKPLTIPKRRVWVNRRSGLYYCRHSPAYGRLVPGTYMDQQEANQVGYSPAPNAGCEAEPVFGDTGASRQAIVL